MPCHPDTPPAVRRVDRQSARQRYLYQKCRQTCRKKNEYSTTIIITHHAPTLPDINITPVSPPIV